MGFDASITGSVASYVGSFIKRSGGPQPLRNGTFLWLPVRSPGPILHHAYSSGIIYIY